MRKVLLSAALLLIQAIAAHGASAEFPLESAKNAPLRWDRERIKIAFSSSLFRQNPNIKSDSDVAGALERSLAAWQRVADISFDTDRSEHLNVSPAGRAGDGINLITSAASAENILIFSQLSSGTPAITRVFFDSRGRITEADIVLNPYQQFSTDGTFGTFDLESVLTHEIGHLLGLDHSTVLGATMYGRNTRNGVFGADSFSKRTLGQSDIAAICDLYGEAETAGTCCGIVTGRVTTTKRDRADSVAVWVEDADTGKVQGAGMTRFDGTYRIGGLSTGNYRVLAGRVSGPVVGSVTEIDNIDVLESEVTVVDLRLPSSGFGPRASLIGLNSQLSDTALPLNAGRSFAVLVGGKSLIAEALRLSFATPLIAAEADPPNSFEIESGYVASAFDLLLDSKLTTGEYSIYVDQSNGGRTVFIGAISVESHQNLLSKSVVRTD